MPNPRRPIPVTLTTVSLFALLSALPAIGQERGLTYNLMGTPGLIEMPTAMSAGDGRLASTLSYFGGNIRGTITFQVTPNLSGSFRYSGVDGYTEEGELYFDRSFDLRYRFNDEGDWMPSIAVGLQDFLGTGLYSGEYVVATRTVSDSVRVTAGIGWGRFAVDGGFSNPLGILSEDLNTRPPIYNVGETGGDLSFDSYFRGDAAVFAGVEWAATDTLTVKAEYSGYDAYRDLEGNVLTERATPFSVGVSWRPADAYQISAAVLNGSEIAVSGTLILDPTERMVPGFDTPPMPVGVRPAPAAALSWDRGAQPEQGIRDRIQAALASEGIRAESMSVTDDTIRLRYTNDRFRADAQAMGRVARILTNLAPASVETFVLEPTRNGIPMSAATFRRSDLERLENVAGGSDAIHQAMVLSDAGPQTGLTPFPPVEDPFSYSLRPYLGLILFGGDSGVRLNYGVELTAEYVISPNLFLTGTTRYRLAPISDPGDVGEWDGTGIPPVRTLIGNYTYDGNPSIRELTLAYYNRPGRDLYGRVTAGLLEPMYGGVSAELLWAPVDSNLAVGGEVNYVVQRDFEQMFGFRDYDTVTGHVSLYYDFDNGFHAQVDAGRYLAGDWGATLNIDRRFENGWSVGGYVTLTEIDPEDYGEGSFDKGIRFTVPTDYFLGQPSRREVGNTIRSLQRDGGARLEVEGRLYDFVRDGHAGSLDDGWGRFWR